MTKKAENLNNAENPSLNIAGVIGSCFDVNIEEVTEIGNKLDEMGKIFRKTKDGRACYYSELSYFESNDL